MLVPLTARGAFTYARQDLKAGQDFEAPEKDAFVLVTIGRAQRRAVYETRVMKAAPVVETPVAIAVVPKKRGRPRKVKTT